MLLPEIAIGDCKFSSVEVWAIRYWGDGPGPYREIYGAYEVQITEEVPSAARCPRF